MSDAETSPWQYLWAYNFICCVLIWTPPGWVLTSPLISSKCLSFNAPTFSETVTCFFGIRVRSSNQFKLLLKLFSLFSVRFSSTFLSSWVLRLPTLAFIPVNLSSQLWVEHPPKDLSPVRTSALAKSLNLWGVFLVAFRRCWCLK